MNKAKNTDKVRVHYTGRLESGEIFDSSADREPLEFTIGSGQLIAGFDEGVLGMELMEQKTISIPAHLAYGPVHEELIQSFPRTELPADINPSIGQVLIATGPEGEEMHLVVKSLSDDFIVLDGNHPLAGETLIFDIQLVEIVA
jgi:FKBP-type peptidyl-prolyl cis-trans isomerase 2